MDDKRVQKTADELQVGDWLAADQMVDGPAEVLHTLSYPGDDGSPHVHLVIRELGARAPYADVVYGLGLMTLATEAELEALRGSAERAQKIADIRAWADFLEANSWAPMPYMSAQADIDFADVYEYGERVGVKAEERLDDRTYVFHRFGGFEYRVIAWHKDGRPAEPAPEPVSLAHYTEDQLITACGIKELPPGHSSYWKTTDYVSCPACLAELASSTSTADPTGLTYTRADDEPDDPTPVSPARVPMHTGAVTETGLVDETPDDKVATCVHPPCGAPIWWSGANVEWRHVGNLWRDHAAQPSPEVIVHFDLPEGESACGLAPTTPHRASRAWEEVTCRPCYDQLPF